MGNPLKLARESAMDDEDEDQYDDDVRLKQVQRGTRASRRLSLSEDDLNDATWLESMNKLDKALWDMADASGLQRFCL